MQGIIANRLSKNKEKIMVMFAEQAKREVDSANTVSALALADSLPLFLDHLAEALDTNRKVDFRSVQLHDAEATRIGKLHGSDRAGSSNYILTEVIFEYHILKEIIIAILEENEQLSRNEYDLILDSIEQAVNDAAVKFTEIHEDIREIFVNTLSHDLRNPLAAIKMSADLITSEANDPGACIRYGNMIITNVNRVDSMIRDLLDTSRLRVGDELTFDLEECKLDSLIRTVVDEMSLIHGDRFVFRSEANVIGYFGADGLRRMFENLIGNAVKYSTANSPITISLKKFKQTAHIVVHNIGNPIPKEEQLIIFEQYRRAKNTDKNSKPGWGLGLTLVKGVVNAHKGSVRVESTEENGTSFIVDLPCPAEAPQSLNTNNQELR